MKHFLLAIGLLFIVPPLFAQEQIKDVLPAIFGVPVESRLEKVPFSDLEKRKQAVLLQLTEPLYNSKQVAVIAWGKKAVLLSQNASLEVEAIEEIKSLYSGSALVPALPTANLLIDNAVQVLPITSLGLDAKVVAIYVLSNTGKEPLDLQVASTSCGCTSAKLEKNRLNAGESTHLTVTMRADDERSVTVSLKTSDPVQPVHTVALQSKRDFAPFDLPAPVSLFGEKGEVVRSQTQIELPSGWRIGRISSTLTWLQTELKAAPTQVPAAMSLFGLQVSAPATAPEGAVEGQITLELLDAPLKELTVTVSGFLSNDIITTPRLVNLGATGTGVARRTVIVRGPKPFSVRGVRSTIPGFKASVDPTVVARAHAVELLIPVEGAVGDALFGRTTLELSDGRQLSIDIFGAINKGKLPELAQNLHIGQAAPVWNGSDANEKLLSSRDFVGRSHLLLTFFPHCFTGGCASHLASLRDAMPALKQAGVDVVAVSVDEAEQVRAFAHELKLPFPLLTDTNRKVALNFGAVQNAQEVPSRLSVLIDKRGVVRWIDTDVQVQTHGADVLAKIHELGLER